MIIVVMSWGAYLACLSIALILYYLFLSNYSGLRDKMNTVVKNKTKHALGESRDSIERNPSNVQMNVKDPKSNERESLNHVAYDLLFEIKSYLSAIGKDVTKEDVLEDLHLVINKYPSLRTSDMKDTINNVISVSCENDCSILLTESEISGLWQDLEHS